MSDSQFFHVHSNETGFVLALEGGTGGLGTKLATAARQTGEPDGWQLWALTPDGHLRHKMTGLVAGTAATQTVSSTPPIPVRLVEYDPTATNQTNQLWTLTSDGHLRSESSGLVLGVAGRVPSQGALVYAAMPDPSGAQAQIWQFVRDVPPVPVVTGRALSLNGTDQFVEVPTPQFGATDLTIEAWVRTTNGGPIVTSVSPSLGAGSPRVPGENIVLAIEPGGSLLFVLNEWDRMMVATSGPTGVLDGEWHHVAAVRQGLSALLYLDGVAVPTGPENQVTLRPIQLANLGGFLWLGRAVSPPLLIHEPPKIVPLHRYKFAGELDEVRVWGRARVPGEIAAGLHHLVSDTEPTLLGRWAFDEGNAADSTPAGRNGTLEGAPNFVDSEVELVAPGEPYLVTQATLTQDWVVDPASPTGMREITGYRVVIAARGPDAAPLPGYLTIFPAADPVSLHFIDGTRADLADGGVCVRSTDVRGEVSFTIDANGSLTCPAVKVRADFMALEERVVVYPDRHAHSALASMTGNALLGQDEGGAPLPSVAKGRRPALMPAGTAPAVADAVAQAINHVMSTAVGHDVQSDRPLTRSRLLPEDLPAPRPYVPRYQDVALVAQGYDPASDAIGTHFLETDQPVVRILVAEQAPTPHWMYDHAGKEFRVMSAEDVAASLRGLNVVHLDDYTRMFKLSPDVFTGRRKIAMRSDALLDTAEGEMSAQWFGGDFLAEVEKATSVIVTTVETVVTDAVSEAEKVVRTIVATVVTGIKDAVTDLVQAFDAMLQTVGDALGFVAALLHKAGAAIGDLLPFLRDLFEWDDILVSQQVIERYLIESRSVLGRMLHGAGNRATKAVEAFRTSLDRDLATWRAALNPDVVQEQATAARTAPPQKLQSTYLTSMFGANIGVDPGGSNLEAEFGALVGGLAGELEKNMARFISNAPNLIDTSGFNEAFADPIKLLGAGVDLLLQAMGALADLGLEVAGDVLKSILAVLDGLLDALYEVGTTRLDVPVLTTFYEQVVMGGNGSRLTLFSLVALAAALPMTVAYKSLSGRDEPVFSTADRDAFLALKGNDYTWIRDPFAVTALASTPPPLRGAVIDRLGWASGFVYVASATIWGCTATVSDLIWGGRKALEGSSSAKLYGGPDQPKFTKPICYVLLGSQLLCMLAGIPWTTDFAVLPDSVAFGLWGSQILPLISNLVASAWEEWAEKFDAPATGLYGLAALGLTVWLWYERDQADGADAADDAAEGIDNIFGSVTWCVQWVKVSPAQSFYSLAALVVLDIVAYAGLAVTTLARTIDSMVEKLA